MSFGDLYKFCQTLTPKIHRNAVRDKVLQLTGFNRLPMAMSGNFTPDTCRGMYLSSKNTDHPFVKQHGTRVIVIARDLNYCWSRFVYVKEVMHAFDDPLHATDSGEKFDRMLPELTGPGSADLSPQTRAEIDAFWMALACFCPEHKRTQLKEERAGGRTALSIATELRIPEQYIPQLFQPNFTSIIDRIIRA